MVSWNRLVQVRTYVHWRLCVAHSFISQYKLYLVILMLKFIFIRLWIISINITTNKISINITINTRIDIFLFVASRSWHNNRLKFLVVIIIVTDTDVRLLLLLSSFILIHPMYVPITLQSRTLYHTGSEKDKLKLLISSAEDWLYGDGFDSTKQQYGKYVLDC